ncbi:uncharacterized protein LOC125178710 isoform X2 [Hyalella azteca]|uniref:Uncharacterized protein LOC125178710 isoform X2 n=1 Tax=Hyalella azteca TaxID=294128 RepID=A0A979FPP4_HYAAZ|nr:uncharacterized protein LOC125178710 isoform X2 [Hyalella azteca]
MTPTDERDARTQGLRQRLHQHFTNVTHFIDDNLRIIQGATYVVAAAGLLRVLLSVRAFTRFNRLDDVPVEFIHKNVRLRGVVRWVGTQPPTSLSIAAASQPVKRVEKIPSVTADLTGIAGSTVEGHTAEDAGDIVSTASGPEPNSSGVLQEAKTGGLVHLRTSLDGSGAASVAPRFTADAIAADAGSERLSCQPQPGGHDATAHARGGGLADGGRQEELYPLYLLVQHLPVIRVPLQLPSHLLPVSLAAVEVTAAAAADCGARLLHQRVWFTPYYVQAAPRVMVCSITLTTFGFSNIRTINEDIVRRGTGIISLVPDAASIEQLARHTPSLMERWQRTAAARFRAPLAGAALVRVDDKSGREMSMLSPAYYKLYDKIKKAEIDARKRRLGVWKDHEGDTEGWFVVRLWHRFRAYTRDSKS